ncbi:hypothetical protein [Paraburkholderia sediminicola]|uniref:hypothetical protein n=1 Tax=Paraburkholderia sediminicola TaxID=458836 RepID=UPI0038BA9611
MRASGASGAMKLITEYDAAGSPVRTLHLESSTDGKGVLLIEVDERKPGIHREVRYEITPSELVAAIRSHRTPLREKPHNGQLIADPT